MVNNSILGNNDELFKKIFAVTRKIWIYILISLFVCLLISAFYIKVTPKVYQAHAQILINDDKSSSKSGVAASNTSSSIDLSQFLTGPKNVDNELGVIRSYKIAYKTVQDLQLNLSVHLKTRFTDKLLYGSQLPFFVRIQNVDSVKLPSNSSIVFELQLRKGGVFLISDDYGDKFVPYNSLTNFPFGSIYLTPNGNLTELGKEDGRILLVIKSLQAATLDFKNALIADIPEKDMSIINLTINNANTELAETYIKQFINNYIEFNISNKKKSADSTIAFVNSRIGSISSELSSVEKNIENFKQTNTISEISANAGALITSGTTATQEYVEQQIQLNVINSLIDYMSKTPTSLRAIPSSMNGVNSPTLTILISNYNTLLLTRDKLLESYNLESDNIKNIDSQLLQFRKDILSSLVNLKNVIYIQLNGAHNNVSNIESKLKKVPNQERVYLDLSRKQNIEQELYVYLLQQKEQAYLAKSAIQPDVDILQIPITDNFSIYPSKTAIYSASLFIGLILPYLIYFIFQKFKVTINTKEEVLNLSEIPILGEIGLLSNKESDIINTNTSRSLLAEQFRILRTNIQYLFKAGNNAKAIMLTSSISGEGKSLIAINLANFLAITGKKVALLELDLRKPTLSTKLKISSQKGISEFAIGNTSYDDIRLELNNLNGVSFFPSGHIPPNPSELIMSEKMTELINRVKSEFDYVIIDSTPLIVTDAQLLAKYVDTTLFVIRMDFTRKEQLKELNDFYLNHKVQNINLIINAIDYKKYSYYSTYGKNQYYSNYIDSKT